MYCLQETHNDNEQTESEWTREWGGTCVWNRATNRSRGVAILLKPGSDLLLGNVRNDSAGRIVAATLLDREKTPQFNVMNAYAPTIPRILQ